MLPNVYVGTSLDTPQLLGHLNTADENIVIGIGTLWLNTTGHDNTANGFEALPYNTTGTFNPATGELRVRVSRGRLGTVRLLPTHKSAMRLKRASNAPEILTVRRISLRFCQIGRNPLETKLRIAMR
jgi:hypothetical protein